MSYEDNKLEIPEGYDVIRLLVGYDVDNDSIRAVDVDDDWDDWNDLDITWKYPPTRIAFFTKKNVEDKEKPIHTFFLDRVTGKITPASESATSDEVEQDSADRPTKSYKLKFGGGF